MSDTRISAADLLRLAAIASVSPEGTADEVVAILQRTGPAEGTSFAEAAPIEAVAIVTREITESRAPAADVTDSNKLAKPE